MSHKRWLVSQIQKHTSHAAAYKESVSYYNLKYVIDLYVSYVGNPRS